MIPPQSSFVGNRLLLADEQKMFGIQKPHHNDVLCGRGVTTNRHPGNESFRSLVGLNKELYVSVTKLAKMDISRSIVQAVRLLDPPGRFLDKDPATLLWHDIGHKKAVEKTSQALRDGAAMLRQQLSADFRDPGFINAVFSDDNAATSTCTPKKVGNDNKAKGKENNNKESKSNFPVKAIKLKPNLTPGSRVPPRNYNMFTPSLHSPGHPPPTHSRSLPNSPITTSNPGLPSHRRHAWSPYESVGNHRVCYQHKHSHKYFNHHHHAPLPPSTSMIRATCSPALSRSSAPPSSTLERALLPPGQHKYSPEEYYSESPPSEPWSPRRYYRHPYESYEFPYHRQEPPLLNFRHGEYASERSSSWTPRSSASPYHSGHYYDESDYQHDMHDNSGGLFIPYLGDVQWDKRERFSPQLHLNPRSHRPAAPRQSGTSSQLPSTNYQDHQQDFRPPTSPGYQRPKNEDSSYYHCARVDEIIAVAYQSKGNGIVTKVNVEEKISSLVTKSELVQSVYMSSQDQGVSESECRQQEGTIKNDADKIEHRVTPGTCIPVKEEVEVKDTIGMDNNPEEVQPVDDIAMSPLPYDREDPVTLLDLPEDIFSRDIQEF